MSIHRGRLSEFWRKLPLPPLAWSLNRPRDFNLRTLADDHDQQIQVQRQREFFAQLRPLDVFSLLDDIEIDHLAREADLKRYTIGEMLIQRGDEGDSLSVKKLGRVRVDVRGANGQAQLGWRKQRKPCSWMKSRHYRKC